MSVNTLETSEQGRAHTKAAVADNSLLGLSVLIVAKFLPGDIGFRRALTCIVDDKKWPRRAIFDSGSIRP